MEGTDDRHGEVRNAIERASGAESSTKSVRLRALQLAGAGALLLSVGLPACGARGLRTFSTSHSKAGQVRAHEWVCALDLFALEGVTAHVTPTFLSLELREGGCYASGAVLGSSSTGFLYLELSSRGAAYHLRVGNPTDDKVAYTAGVSYVAQAID